MAELSIVGYEPPDVRSMIDEAADRYGVPRNLAHTVASMESGYDQSRRSPKGAIGVMQLMPATAREMGVNPLDTAENIQGGMQYLAQLWKESKGKPDLTMAAYNAGPGAVKQYGGIPPFPETQAYVMRGTKLLAQAQPAPAPASAPGLSIVGYEPLSTAPVKHPMPEPAAAVPKIAALQPGAPAPPGLRQRLYEQTVGGPFAAMLGSFTDPIGQLKETIANLTAAQIQGVRTPTQIQPSSPVAPIIEDVRSGNIRGAVGGGLGLGLTLAGPKIIEKTPPVVRATPTAVKGGAKGAYQAAVSPRTRGEVGVAFGVGQVFGPKAGAATQATLTGTRIVRGAWKGARAELAARATRAAETLAAERTAAQAAAAEAARSRLIPEERRLNAPAPPPDTSYVRSVPADPLPPSRQLAAPGRPAIITPAPDPLAGDTSGVRSLPAVYGTSATNEAAAGMREAMGVEPGKLAPPTVFEPPGYAEAVREGGIERMARTVRAHGLDSASFKQLDPPKLADLARATGVEGPLREVQREVVARLKKIEKAEAETAMIQAALDRLSPAERAVTRAEKGPTSRFAEAPVVERKPPATAAAAEPTVTTPAEANVELGKQYPAPAPVEKPAALTASQKRVAGMAAILAEGDIPVEQLRGGLKTDVRARLFLESESQRLGYGKIAPGELDKIIAEIERLRSEAPTSKAK